jgi:hypothetical protein
MRRHCRCLETLTRTPVPQASLCISRRCRTFLSSLECLYAIFDSCLWLYKMHGASSLPIFFSTLSLLVLRADKGLDMESEENGFMAEEGSSGFAQKRPRMMAQTTVESRCCCCGCPSRSQYKSVWKTMVATPASLDAAVPNGIQQPLGDGWRITEYAWRPLRQHVLWESVDAHAAKCRSGAKVRQCHSGKPAAQTEGIRCGSCEQDHERP